MNIISERDYMSEYEPLPPIEIEDDAVALIEVSGGEHPIEFHATRHNTKLTTYLGRAAFNNIFVWDEEKSMRVFKEADQYEVLEQYAIEHHFPMSLNETEVPAEVQEMYVKMNAQQIPNGVPEDW